MGSRTMDCTVALRDRQFTVSVSSSADVVELQKAIEAAAKAAGVRPPSDWLSPDLLVSVDGRPTCAWNMLHTILSGYEIGKWFGTAKTITLTTALTAQSAPSARATTRTRPPPRTEYEEMLSSAGSFRVDPSLPNAQNPPGQTHQWWSQRGPERCPTCRSKKEVQDSYINVMFGVYVHKHCKDCGQRWLCKIAEAPD